ncbi:putative TOM core complex subunit Tom6 [Hypoxylon sp. FL1284]|nr:putative TOM core complex subunit Tom6 [Hypoxylon sp. FL1284]
MPPKRVSGRSNKGYISSTYESLTSPDNASVVRSVALFGAAVAFLASPWGAEQLLPP